MHKLQNSLTILTNPRQESLSLLDDRIFQAFHEAIGDDQSDGAWHFITAYQDYPDPSILLRAEFLAEDIARAESGKQIDYAKIRRSLATAEADLSGSNEDKRKMFEMCNKLVESHVSYVRATAKVLGYELYDKLIDRFYRKVKDDRFDHFIANIIMPISYEAGHRTASSSRAVSTTFEHGGSTKLQPGTPLNSSNCQSSSKSSSPKSKQPSNDMKIDNES